MAVLICGKEKPLTLPHRLVAAPGRGWQVLFALCLWCPTLLTPINSCCHTSNLMSVCAPDVRGSTLIH